MNQVDVITEVGAEDVTSIDYGTGGSDVPVIGINTSETWAYEPVVLKRTSLIYEKPTEFGKFHQPRNWMPIDEIIEEWGTLQLIMDGKDVTYFRDHPVEIGSWASNEPNGDAAFSVYFPQISWFERPGYNDITFVQGGNDVELILHRPDGSTKTLFEGLIVGHAYSGQGIGVSYDILGVLYQADHTPYIQELYKRNRDIGTAIADIMDGTISRHFLPCNRPVTGIRTNIRGSGGARLTQGVQDLLSTAYTADATNQWTITNLPGRRPFIKLKDKTTHHWSIAVGNPDLEIDLSEDFQSYLGMVWGSGIANDGCAWFNAKYPGVRIDDVPPYPLAVGAVFNPGSGSTGFDAFADEMRTRGYGMASGDTYSSEDEFEVRDMQRRAGITEDGIVGAQTWNAAFGVGGSLPSLEGAHIAPLAAYTGNVQFLERPDGSIIGPNPRYDRSLLAVGRLVEYGEGVDLKEGMRFAQQEINTRIRNDPPWVGSATIKGDPEEGSRWEIRAGQNIFIKHFFAPLARLGIDDGLLLHISQATVNPGGDVTVQLSFLAHDMTTLAAIKNRNKNTLDPARRGVQTRNSRITKDNVVPWDCEAGGGKVPVHNLQGGFWTVSRIPAGQIGRIVETRYICGTGVTPSMVGTAFESESALPGARKFIVAFFGRPITSNYLKNLGNPFGDSSFWSSKAAILEKAGLIQAYGQSGQAAGFWPNQEAKSGALTGKLLDGSSWSWESQSPPYLWVAEYCESSTRIGGQLRNDVLGSN